MECGPVLEKARRRLQAEEEPTSLELQRSRSRLLLVALVAQQTQDVARRWVMFARRAW